MKREVRCPECEHCVRDNAVYGDPPLLFCSHAETKVEDRSKGLCVGYVHPTAIACQHCQARVPSEDVELRALPPQASSGTSLPSTRAPWPSGSFYLLCGVALIGVAVVAERTLANPAHLPVVLIFGFLTMLAVGGLQWFQDRRISERGIRAFIAALLKPLPLVCGTPSMRRRDMRENRRPSSK